MNLSLSRPLVFFDLEATGIQVSSDRIVEIALLKFMPDSSRQEYKKLVNPQIPIPIEVSAIHGIYDVDVIDAPTFNQIAQEIKDFIADADLAGFNSNKFDVPMLLEEMERAGVDFTIAERHLVDVQNIFHKKEERTLSAAYKFYCNKELKNAHSAMADTEATAEVLFSQLEKYNDLENNVEFLDAFSRMGNRNLDFAGRIATNNNGEAIFNFGKHKGKAVKEVLQKEPSYYHWMMNGDFPAYTKRVLTSLKEQYRL